MNSSFIKKEIPIWLIMALPVIYLLIVWDQVPGEIPSHWNLSGEIDGYAKPWVFPIILIGVYLLMLFIPRIDPRKQNYDIFSSSYYRIRIGIITFLSLIFGISIAISTGIDFPMNRVIVIAVLALISFMGNYLGTIRPNWFIGIRTPWTLENEEVWRKTHLLAGRFWFWGGLLGILLMFLLPATLFFALLISIVVIISLTPILYSYFLHKNLTK